MNELTGFFSNKQIFSGEGILIANCATHRFRRPHGQDQLMPLPPSAFGSGDTLFRVQWANFTCDMLFKLF